MKYFISSSHVGTIVAILTLSHMTSIVAFEITGVLIQRNGFRPSVLQDYHCRTPSFSTTTSLKYSNKKVNDLSDVFILSFDGLIADTLEWRSNLAIDVALDVWSEDLNELVRKETYNIENDRLWLINKISALLPDIMTGSDGMMGTDAVFLARLLLEEQLLDDGRSNGCNGKYGSKFHPTSSAETVNEASSNKQGSRPLTVGEIAANWNHGGCIKDTVRVKYHLHYKDPVIFIEKAIESKMLQLQRQNETILSSDYSPHVYDIMIDALKDCPSSIFILVGHESHSPFVRSVLQQSGIQVHSIVKSSQAASLATLNGIYLLTPDDECKEHSQVIQTLLTDLESSMVHVLHSDIFTLNELKVLLDHVPRRGAYTDCTVGKDNQLKLTLPSWGTSLQAQNGAEMDAWLSTCQSPLELVEILSTRILSD